MMIEVALPRHGFMAFALRAGEAVFDHVHTLRVDHRPAHTIVELVPCCGRSNDLAVALKACIEPGETITSGTQSWTLERCSFQEPSPVPQS